jgi:hypothetical protein
VTVAAVHPAVRSGVGLTYDLYAAPAQDWFSVADIAAVARLARRYGSVAAMEQALARLDVAVPALAAPPPPSAPWSSPRALHARAAVPQPSWPAAPWQAWPAAAPYAASLRPAPVEVVRAVPPVDPVPAYTWGVCWRFVVTGGAAIVLLGGVPGLPRGWLLLGTALLALLGLRRRLWRGAGSVAALWRALMAGLLVVVAMGLPPLLPAALVGGVAVCALEPAVLLWARRRRWREPAAAWGRPSGLSARPARPSER